MQDSPTRLVLRIQQQLKAADRATVTEFPDRRDMAELEDRLRRLHAMGDRFVSVGLSPFVTANVLAAPNRVRGECVATEV